ncbi:unnamed protein product [Taenia asiatica]|uniref:Transposase n=1 Tax=Taenia asiatica TaxID=60517 RepID=A0A0R3VVB3_TAEAS|nr:unnamed protein product [Taenia asiatica]
MTAWYRSYTPAPSIFRAADADFHGHRPTVYIYQHLLWYLMSVSIRHLNQAFGSSHSASSAYQNGPLSTHTFNAQLHHHLQHLLQGMHARV